MLSILLTILYTVQAAHKGRKEEFARITKYELMNLHPTDTSDEDIKTLQFDIYNQHYNIQLIRNHDMIPTATQHNNVDPTTHKHQYFTSLTQSCHFHGRVLNTQHRSLVAISLCPNRGIRGTIEAFNQTLIIQPSAYYLDFNKDKYHFHEIHDQVLIYRFSDFNTSDVNAVHGAIYDQNKTPLKSDQQNNIHHNDNKGKVKGKRRLAYYTASNPARLEEFIVTGPVRTKNYQDLYGETWYQELTAKYTDMVNQMSAIYKATDWGSSVGRENSISIVFAGIEVIFAFTGDYASLTPDKLYSNCAANQFDDTDICAINGNKWLGTIKTWVSNYLDNSKFDNVQFVSDMRFKWTKSGSSTSRTLGWGYIGTVCTGSSVTDVSVVSDMGGETAAVRTMAHELGHNFNMEHDGQEGTGSGCLADAGLMGYSDGTGFSSCSIAALQQYFSESNGLTCIGNGWPKDFISNHDDGATGSPTKRPTQTPTNNPIASPTNNPTRSGQTVSPTQRPTTSPTKVPTQSTNEPSASPTQSPIETTCVRITGVDDYFYDGTYNELTQRFNGATVYELVGANSPTFIYKPNGNSYWNNGVHPAWVWGGSIGSGTISVYCTESEIMNCGGKFTRYTSDGWIYYPSSTIDTTCGTAEECQGYNCVGVAGIDGYQGQFIPSGCYNGYKYYTNRNVNVAAILCFNDNYNRWIITRTLCSPYTGEIVGVSGSGSTEVVRNGWYVATDSSSLSYNQNVMVNDCGGGGALNIGDLECLTYNPYDNQLCVSNNNTLWNGDRTFELYDKLCKNDAPIYHYTVVNRSNGGIMVDGNQLNDEDQTVFYLHYHVEKRWVDSNETIGQWLISKNEISVNSIAVCEKDNLLQCTGNTWKVETTQYGDFQLDGLLLRVTDKDLTVNNGECLVVDKQNSNKKGNEWIIIVIILVIVIIGAVVVYCVCRKMNESESMKIKQSLGKHTQTATDRPMEDEMQQEIEIEVEVSMEKNITQTQD